MTTGKGFRHRGWVLGGALLVGLTMGGAGAALAQQAPGPGQLRIPAHAGRRFRSMPATHSGACRPPREHVEATLDSAGLGYPPGNPKPGGTRWPLSDYPCARFERSSA